MSAATAWAKDRRHASRYRDNSSDRELAIGLSGMGRSVSEKAPLQDQFSERIGAGRTRVEKQGRQAVSRMYYNRACSNVKIDIGKIRVIAGPTLRFRENDRA